jgi:hypothetical protein
MFKQDKSVDRNLCFVLMPFYPELEPVYKKIQEVVVIDHKLSCLRADNIYSVGIIIKEIWDSVQTAQIIISDATGKNPNVFYEMGLAHAIGKDIVIIAQSIEDIPFDLRHRRIIIYDPHRLDELEIKLSKTIDGLKWKPIDIIQWLTTENVNIRVGLSFPTDKTTVHKTPIETSGRVVGLPDNDLHFWIQAFVKTDKEYEQGTSSIDKNGFWKINEVHLGAINHKLYFRIYDESGRTITESETIAVYKR